MKEQKAASKKKPAKAKRLTVVEKTSDNTSPGSQPNEGCSLSSVVASSPMPASERVAVSKPKAIKRRKGERFPPRLT
jgi:hypothetical protein